MHHTYRTNGVCSTQIDFDIENNKDVILCYSILYITFDKDKTKKQARTFALHLICITFVAIEKSL